MKDRNIRACVRAVLFTSLFSSIAFAGTDFIDWETNALSTPPSNFSIPAVIETDGGATLTVDQSLVDPIVGSTSAIVPFDFLPGWLDRGNYARYWTNYQVEYNLNTITFSSFTGISVCGFSTHIAPVESGAFEAQIEAFTSNAILSDTTDPNSETDAALIGISSTEPMDSVEITMLSTGGMYPGYYAIDRVELTTCDTVTVPHFSCEGFAPPMDVFPVSAKKNRAFPLKMELFDKDGYAQSDAELAASPVVTVMFTESIEDEAADISSDVLSTGSATEGNQFEFTDNGIWQFNLQSKNYSASGTYLVTVVSGDESEYVIDPACVTSFMIN